MFVLTFITDHDEERVFDGTALRAFGIRGSESLPKLTRSAVSMRLTRPEERPGGDVLGRIASRAGWR